MGAAESVVNVANASDYPIVVCYSHERMAITSLKAKIESSLKSKATVGISLKDMSASSALSAKERVNTEVNYQREVIYTKLLIPPHTSSCIRGEERNIYACVWLINIDDDDDDMEFISVCENYVVPQYRSFIVTGDPTIKFQKQGADIWVDEEGKNHRK